MAKHYKDNYKNLVKMIKGRLFKTNFFGNVSDDISLDAEDIVQNAYLMCLTYPNYKEDGDFNAWIGTILNNEFVKGLKTLRKGQGVVCYMDSRDEKVEDTCDKLSEFDMDDYIHNEINPILTKKQVEIFDLLLRGNTQKDICDIMDISKQNCNNIVNRIREKIRMLRGI